MPEIKTVTLFDSDASQIIINKTDTAKYKKLGFMTEKEFKTAEDEKAKAAEEKAKAQAEKAKANAKANKTDTENSKSETLNDATTTTAAETDPNIDKTTKAV